MDAGETRWVEREDVCRLLERVVYLAVKDVIAGNTHAADALRWFKEEGVECAVVLGWPRAGVEDWLIKYGVKS